MATPEEINADMLAFWDGQGGRTWVERQANTDTTLLPVTKALLDFAAPKSGERVLDVGCGCGAPTLDFARAVGPSGRVAALDISGPMLAEAETRAKAAAIANIDWRKADPSKDSLTEYDLLISAFGTMFFGDTVGAFSHMRRAARPDARMAIVCWRSLAENPWIKIPMSAVAQHLPPRPEAKPHAPGMFAFADPDHVTQVLTTSGWTPPNFTKFDVDLDIAAAGGLSEAVKQATKIGVINSWLRNQPEDVVSAAVASLNDALAPYVDGANVRLRGAMWLISSTPA
jgi:SAM-dependent methyltransferase